MRRLAPLALVVAALTIAAPAGAATGYTAKGATEFRISFDVVFDDGEPARGRNFVFSRVVMTCESGPKPNPFKTKSLAPFGPFRVSRDGRFGRRFPSDDQNFRGETVIRGEFVTRKRVRGTLRIQGDYPDATYAGCDSGRLRWKAALT